MNWTISTDTVGFGFKLYAGRGEVLTSKSFIFRILGGTSGCFFAAFDVQWADIRYASGDGRDEKGKKSRKLNGGRWRIRSIRRYLNRRLYNDKSTRIVIGVPVEAHAIYSEVCRYKRIETYYRKIYERLILGIPPDLI